MAKIDRKKQEIFAVNSPLDCRVPGETVAGNLTDSTDLDEIQGTAFQSGLGAMTVGGTRLPSYKEFNAIYLAITQQLAYGFQSGIPEYHAGTEYHEGDYAREVNTGRIYQSLTSPNIANLLTDTNNWEYQGPILQTPVGGIIQYAGSLAAVGAAFLPCDGRNILVADYPELYAAIGDNWGTPGSVGVDFYLPDMRDKYIIGAGGSLTLADSAGSNTVDNSHSHTLSIGYTTLTTAQMPPHVHEMRHWQENDDSGNGGSNNDMTTNSKGTQGPENYIKNSQSTGGGASHSHTAIANIGGISSQDNRPQSLGFNILIRAK